MDYTRLLFSEISFKPAHHKQQQQHSAKTITTTTTNHERIVHNNNINSNQNGNNVKKQIQEEFQTARHQLCDPNTIRLDWLQSEKVGGGLINVGNTCFLNSVLQCLTYCPPLYNFLVKSDGGHSSQCKLNQFCMLCEMEKHVKTIRNSNGSAIKPISIVQRLKYINKSFQYGRQEDAHEFLRYLIDHMWKACLSNHDINGKSSKIDPKIKETTMINHIFGGYHRSQVLCLTCNSRSNTYDFFMDFILDIRNAKSLEEALRRFTQPETLENENAYKCGKCRKKVTARKKFTVYKAPNVATFQLKRFDSDRIFGGKVTKFISYPEELDLRPYMSDPTKTPIKYNLSAVLVHIGHSSNSGHYFCFIKNSNNFWYRMDDSSVALVNQNTVLQQQAYVLFYNRKSTGEPEPSTTLVTSSRPVLSNGNVKSNHHNNHHQHHHHPQQHQQIQIQHQQHNNSNNINININKTPGNHNTTNNSFTTWSGSRSKLDAEDSYKRKFNDSRDKFNDELDQGKVKKIKSRSRDDRFSYLSKSNPFQRYNNNSYLYKSSSSSNNK